MGAVLAIANGKVHSNRKQKNQDSLRQMMESHQNMAQRPPAASPERSTIDPVELQRRMSRHDQMIRRVVERAGMETALALQQDLQVMEQRTLAEQRQQLERPVQRPRTQQMSSSISEMQETLAKMVEGSGFGWLGSAPKVKDEVEEPQERKRRIRVA